MRANNRSRLYVHPLHWTSEHLRLLNCRFAAKQHWKPRKLGKQPGAKNENKERQSKQQHDEAASLSKDESIRGIVKNLLRPSMTEFEIVAMRYFLEGHDINLHE